MRFQLHTFFTAFFVLIVQQGHALADLVVGPQPYLSQADIPFNFYQGGLPVALENFEDDSLGFGITASAGEVFPASGASQYTDSVDGDDGNIDGSGMNGHSWFFSSGPDGVKFTFNPAEPLPTAAGIVWTDGGGGSQTTFEAFGPGDVLLGTVSATIADDNTTGQTAEDRFFGIQALGGISAIKLSNTSGGIEVDHVQYGAAAVPEPSSAILVLGMSVMFLPVYKFLRRRSN